MQAPKSCSRDHPTTRHRADSAAWRFLAQPEMSSVLVVVADVFAEKAFQVLFVEQYHMIEQVASSALHLALGDSVQPGTSE
jgi:hypothetical protein